MRRRGAGLLLAASLLAAAPLAAAPRIDVVLSGDTVELTASETSAAAVLQRLAATAGFSVEGLESLPATPVSLHLRGPLERVIAGLLDPASRVATYAPGDTHRLSRLVLLPSAAGPPPPVVTGRALPPPPVDLAADDPAVGASRIGTDRLRAGIGSTLGLSLR